MKLGELLKTVDDVQAINLRVIHKGSENREIDFYKNEKQCYCDYIGETVRLLYTYSNMLCVEVGDKIKLD